ncbi:MAG: VOC family protein [Egibacteraceae bacterium]
MSSRPVSVVVDAMDPAALARFWAAALGWEVTYEAPDEVVVEVGEEGGEWGDTGVVPLVFGPVPEPKVGKNRAHLDLASSSEREQAEIVDRLIALGGRRADIGQTAVPWEVLADPEGNELCVLEPRETYHGVEGIAAVVLDCIDPVALAGFWREATGWQVDRTATGFVGLRPTDRTATALELVAVPEPKATKDRLHVDLAPRPDDDHLAEVARLTALGARTIDIGQGDVSWVVLTDPEGHELCVLTPR